MPKSSVAIPCALLALTATLGCSRTHHPALVGDWNDANDREVVKAAHLIIDPRVPQSVVFSFSFSNTSSAQMFLEILENEYSTEIFRGNSEIVELKVSHSMLIDEEEVSTTRVWLCEKAIELGGSFNGWAVLAN